MRCNTQGRVENTLSQFVRAVPSRSLWEAVPQLSALVATSLSNFLENGFQPGLSSLRKYVTVPTVCRSDVVDSGGLVRDLLGSNLHSDFVDGIKVELRPNSADAMKKSRQRTATCENSKPCPESFICLSTSRDEFDGGGPFQF